MIKSIKQFPLLLTLFRLIVSPLVLPHLLVSSLPLASFATHVWVALCFIGLSLTDFFDGYLARFYKQETRLGKMLDPIADKFLLLSTLIPLVYIHKIYYYWAIIFIAREFSIISLRYGAQTYGIELAVTQTAKLKTAAQSLFFAWVILNPYQQVTAPLWNGIETLLLLVALSLTILSAIQYVYIFQKKYRLAYDLP